MTLSELTPEAISKAYLNRHEKITLSDGDHDPLWLWEELIADDPEKAWQIFQLLLEKENDDDALEQIVYRIHQLLSNHWDSFHERVKILISNHNELPCFLPISSIIQEKYTTFPISDETIVQASIQMHNHSEYHSQVEELIRQDPEKALPLVLEIIHRGQLYEFSSFDLFSTLQDLLRQHGSLVIDRVEQSAKSSVMLKRCLWRMRRNEEGTSPEYRIDQNVWLRACAAAGNTNDYNSELPAEVEITSLSEQNEQLLISWFIYEA